MKRLEDRPWWPELVSLKDTLSLRELAERFGAAPAAIANALRRNNLDRAPAPPGPRAYRDPAWRAAADAATAQVETKPVEPPKAEPVKAEKAKSEKSAAKAEKAAPKADKSAKLEAAPAKAAKASKGSSKAAKPAPVAEAPVAAVEAPVAAVAVAAPVVEAVAAVESAPAAPRKEIDKATPILYMSAMTASAPAVRQVRGYRAMINGDGYVIVASNVAEAASIACNAERGDVVSIELLGLALAL